MKQLHLAIVLPIFNGLDFTQKCLKNLDKNLNHPELNRNDFIIIVIDDGSTDGSSQWIKTHFPSVVILKGDGTLWWSGGINKGIEYALNKTDTTHVLMWNNDIYTESDYLFEVCKALNIYSANTIIGSKIYFADQPDIIWAMGGLFNLRTGKKEIFGTRQQDSIKYEEPFEADWLPGMGTIVHRDVFEKIGLMDALNFPQYHGDSDFTLRAKLAGYKIVALPFLRIWNDKSNSGLHHVNSFSKLITSLHDFRSNNHIGKDILFYRRYATSILAYQVLLKKYYLYIGGFFKWKVLKLFGIKKEIQK